MISSTKILILCRFWYSPSIVKIQYKIEQWNTNKAFRMVSYLYLLIHVANTIRLSIPGTKQNNRVSTLPINNLGWDVSILLSSDDVIVVLLLFFLFLFFIIFMPSSLQLQSIHVSLLLLLSLLHSLSSYLCYYYCCLCWCFVIIII